MSDGYARVLGASQALLKLWRALNLFCAAAFVVATVASFVFEPVFRGYFERRAMLDPGLFLPILRLWVITALPVFAAVHIMVSRLLEMIGTVRAGDPFLPENAARLRTIAWCLLVVQLFDLACGVFIGILTRAGADLGGGWDPSLGGWVAVLLLFVLARVFEEGARIRADLEAVV
ncbi:MAG TPA: DUF2975 domain-containing protein [Allosphingosinicella sp.]|jgi:hypothetical protein